MTTRHSGYLVTLERNLRDDDSANIINAIKMLRGVLDVTPIESTDMTEAIAERRVRTELENKIWKAFHPEQK